MPVNYINHKGRNILHVNLRDVKRKDDVMNDLDNMARFYQEAQMEIYLLLDMSGTLIDPEAMNKLKYYGKTVFRGKSKKRAVLGIKGLKRLLLKAYKAATGTDVMTFDSLEDAKDYLAS